MGEKLLNSGDAGGEKEALHQAELITRISQTSDVLSSSLTEGKTWHIVSPKFSKPPPIFLGGYDISEKLYEMAERIQDLHVGLQILPEEFDDEGNKEPSCYAWEIYPPPARFKSIGKFVSECHQDRNLPGFGLSFFCPKLTKAVTPVDLRDYRESGPTDIDMLTWFEDGETRYDWKKPQSVLLDMIKHDPTASLETALWILESLHTAKEIHAEDA